MVHGAESRPYPKPNVINAEAAITQKTSRSTEIQDSDLRRVASAVTSLPTPQMTDSPFLKALGTQTIRTAPAQTGELAQRAAEEWERMGRGISGFSRTDRYTRGTGPTGLTLPCV